MYLVYYMICRFYIGSGRPIKITSEVMRIVNEQMSNDDETMAHQLHKLLNEKGIVISINTILRCHKTLGWTFRGSAYCQLIRVVNKQKILEWAQQYLNEAKDGFDDTIFSDEPTIQLETHKYFCYRKKGCKPKRKPRSYILYSVIIYWNLFL